MRRPAFATPLAALGVSPPATPPSSDAPACIKPSPPASRDAPPASPAPAAAPSCCVGLAAMLANTFPATPGIADAACAPRSIAPPPVTNLDASPITRSLAPCGLGRPSQSASADACSPVGLTLTPALRISAATGSVNICAVCAGPSSAYRAVKPN
ncbi:MAG: hypothetical protein CTY21_13325 [Methylomonas sp.]|nr:MAG: hypothetical protein CTY21_13325 [Methylomonas sp.]